MATAAVTYTFSADEDAVASEVNVNFSDVISFLNNSVVHLDGSKTMTGALVLPASDPVSANQATRKSYVNAGDAAATAVANGAVSTANSASSAAAAAQSTANSAIARVPLGVVRWGRHDGSVNGAGDTFFSHGLGGTPTSITLTVTGAGMHIYKLAVENLDTVNVNVRVFDSRTGAAVTSGSVAFYWMAARNL